MNGFLAAMFWTSTLITPDQLGLSNGEIEEPLPFNLAGYSRLEFQKDTIGQELQYVRGHDIFYGDLQAVSSFSITDQGGIWFGHGLYNELALNDIVSVGLSFIPGVYIQGDEVDLGGWLMFRSGLECILPINSTSSISISYDHRSSGDIWPFNPGLESWQVRLRTYM